MQQCKIIYYFLAALHVSSDTFAHHQEHLNCVYCLQYYTRELLSTGFMREFQLSHAICWQQLTCIIPEAVNTVQMLPMMSESIARNMQSSQGIINYPAMLHLVRYFRILSSICFEQIYSSSGGNFCTCSIQYFQSHRFTGQTLHRCTIKYCTLRVQK